MDRETGSTDFSPDRPAGNDREAFERLWREHQRPLRGFLSARLSPTQLANDLEDLLQKIFLEADRRFPSYDPGKASFYTWLRIWAGYVLKRHYRKAKDHLSLDIISEEGGEPAGSSPSPADIIIENERMAETLDAFRRFLRLVFDHGGYPHQVMALVYVKLLDWKPRSVVSGLSDRHLRSLAKEGQAGLVSRFSMGRKEIEAGMRPLHSKMELTLSAVIPEGDASWSTITADARVAVGDTVFPDYWANRPGANLSNWVLRVKERVLKKILEEDHRGLFPEWPARSPGMERT